MEYLWRVVPVDQFSELLLLIGDGNYPESEGNIIKPSGLGMIVGSLKDLLAEIYPNVASVKEKPVYWLHERAILTPKNGICRDQLYVIEGENMNYRSVDSVLEVDNTVRYPLEFLNSSILQVFQLIDLF